jgi:beta-glucuronidase
MKPKILLSGFSLTLSLLLVVVLSISARAMEIVSPANTVVDASAIAAPDLSSRPIEELVKLAWAASGKGDYAALDHIFDVGLKTYEQQAMLLHSNLTGFPPRDHIGDYQVMNDVATMHFIRAEALMHQGKNEESIALFKEIIREYPYSQAWDPSRGSYWSIADKSQASIDVMTGVEEQREEAQKNLPLTLPKLVKTGKDKVVDYKKYGRFVAEGTKDFKFEMGRPSLLADAVGEGIYPNTADVLKNPEFKQLYKEGRLSGSHWDFVNTKDLEAAYFKWATAPENPGVKLFYTALIFEKSKMYLQAIKAYHALIVNFPKSVAVTYWQTPWYPAQAAVAKIKNILRLHPELGLTYRGGKVRVVNGNDNDTTNDIFVVWPGVIEKSTKDMVARSSQVFGQPKRELGGKKTRFVQYENGHWRMFVDGEPFLIKGITYSPTKIGQSPDKGTLADWMTEDTNHNGEADGPYDSWVDKNKNNIQDPDEPTVGDFQILKEMGANAMRIYHQPFEPDKAVLRDMYDRFGIGVIMGDFLGKYTNGSGADWATGTDYENPTHRANMMKSVEAMVKSFKDEPYVLMWVLGNENNYGVACNADKKPEVYYKFVNEVAKRIKELDPTRPVAICNGDTLFLDIFTKYAPDIDAFGANVYRGDYGFGSFWDQVRVSADRPAFITEFGAPAYSKQVGLDEAETEQADYHKGSWLDIVENSAGYEDGEGNAVGGIAFEWTDEWFKNYEPYKHDTKADVIGPFAGGYYFEEWFGLTSQGDGSKSPFLRQLRKAYFTYKDLWNK